MSGTPYIGVKIEGNDVTQQLLRVVLDEDEQRTDALEVVLYDTTPIYMDSITEGMQVEVELGDDEDHPLAFRGLIWRVEAEFRATKAPVLTLHAMDGLGRLGKAPTVKRHWGTNVQSIVQQLASSAGAVPGDIKLPPQDQAPTEHFPIQQQGETDLSFLFRLAERYQCRAYLEHKDETDKLHFVSIADLVASKPLKAPLLFPSPLTRFAPSFDMTQTVKGLKQIMPDSAKGDPVTLEAKPANPAGAAWTPDPDVIDHVPDGDRELVAKFADKGASHQADPSSDWPEPGQIMGSPSRETGAPPPLLVDESRWQGMRAWGEVGGYHLLRPRVNVTVQGVGGRFSGQWYVTRTIHEFDVQGRNYITRFAARR